MDTTQNNSQDAMQRELDEAEAAFNADLEKIEAEARELASDISKELDKRDIARIKDELANMKKTA